jgi:hypothetical protein
MKKIFFTILLSFFIFLPNASAVSVGQLACEAIMCLSTISPPGQCFRSLKYYYSIDVKRLKSLAKARVNFLKMCTGYRGDVTKIVANAPSTNPLTGGESSDTTNSGAASSYSGIGAVGNGLSENGGSYLESGNGNLGHGSGSSSGSTFDSGNSAGGGGGESSDDDSENDDSSQKIAKSKEKNATEDSSMIDIDEDGIADISLEELKLKCGAEELNRIQDFSKTKVRTTAKLPDYCLTLLDFEVKSLPIYTCKEEFYLNEDWEKGYVSEETELEKYKAWKANGGDGHTLINDNSTAVIYIINNPIKKECWIEANDITDDINVQEVDTKIPLKMIID